MDDNDPRMDELNFVGIGTKTVRQTLRDEKRALEREARIAENEREVNASRARFLGILAILFLVLQFIQNC